MLLTRYSLVMSYVWGVVLILLLHIFRKRLHLLNGLSLKEVTVLYSVCLLRMILPVELPWTRGIATKISNPIFDFFLIPVTLGQIHCTIYEIVLFVWFVDAAFFIFRFFKKYYDTSVRLKKMPSRSYLKDIFLTRKYTRKKIDIRESPYIKAPFSFGIRHRMIFLPEREYTGEERTLILKHEAMHHIHQDLLVKFVLEILCAFYWWNPLVYILRNEISYTMELHCDESVIRNGSKKQTVTYLKTLLSDYKNFGVTRRKNRMLSADMCPENQTELEDRFLVMKKQHDQKKMVKKGKETFFLILLLIVFLFSYGPAFQPHFEPPEDEITENSDDTFEVIPKETVVVQKNGRFYIKHKGKMSEIDAPSARWIIKEGAKFEQEDIADLVADADDN